MEELILQILAQTTHPVKVSSIHKLYPTQRSEVSTAISNLTVTGKITTFVDRGRLLVVNKTIYAQKTSETVSVKSKGEVINITPKIVPSEGDWAIKEINSDCTLYFDKSLGRDQVRGAFRKITKVNWCNIRPARYHKKNTLREARNNNF